MQDTKCGLNLNESCCSQRDLFYQKINQLIQSIQALPINQGIDQTFIDFDDTIFNSACRYLVDPDLRLHRGDKAINFIKGKYQNSLDPTGLVTFTTLLKVKENLFSNIGDFYDPKNPHNIILTAGNRLLQRLKIDAGGFNGAKRIIVEKAESKIIAILLNIKSLGYIPGRLTFIDDRIDNFSDICTFLRVILGSQVDFIRAIPNTSDNYVSLATIVNRTNIQTEQLISGFIENPSMELRKLYPN